MATKIESTEITQPKKVFVKSEEALDEMEANGQLEPFTDYYTDDESSNVDYKLVWENANPYTQFNSKTITIEDVGKYNFIVVEILVYASDSRDACVKYMKFPKTTTRKCCLEFSWNEESNLKTFIRSRMFILLNNTSIQFYGGYQAQVGSTAVNDNMVLIPRRIYGTNQL